MDLRSALMEEHSKEQTRKIACWIGNNEKRISVLMDIFMHGEYRVVQRAAWIVSEVSRQYPEAMQQHTGAMIQRLTDEGVHVAVRRHVLRVMQYLELPEAQHGPLMNACFDFLIDPKEALAVRAFAMSVLARLAFIYPEINNELRLIIEDTLSQKPAASFISRAKRVLKQIGRH